MKKFAVGVACVLCMLLIFPIMSAAKEGNLIRNGGFEELQAGTPVGWEQDLYVQNPGVSALSVEREGARTGSAYVRIRNIQPNDAKWVQKAAVKPDTLYRLACWVRVEAVGDGGAGANISVLGIGSISQDLKDTGGQWQQIEFIGKTGADQQEITVAVRLGAYGSLNTGTAGFGDFSLEELSEASAGILPVLFASGEETAPAAAIAHPGYSSAMIGFALLYALFFAAVLYWMDKRQEKKTLSVRPVGLMLPAAALAAAFVIRMLFASVIQGHPIDFIDFNGWANHVYTRGLPNFYGGGMFVDYPPGYIYVLYVVGWLKHLFAVGIDSGANILLIKLPAMTADLLAGCFLYRLAAKRFGSAAGTGLALLYMLNPCIFVNSVVWGQIDAVFTLFILLATHALTEKKVPTASVYYVIALLIKPQALVFAPLLLFALIEQRNWKIAGRSVLYGAAAFTLCLLPFSLHQDPFWIVRQYKEMFGMYPYLSVNAFNLYAFLGLNAAPAGPYQLLDILLVIVIAGFAAYLFFKSKDAAKYAYIGLLLVLLVFALKAGMHERYGFPAVALAIMSYIQLRDRRLLYLFAVLGMTHFANAAYVLKFSFNEHYYIANSDIFMKMIALANLILTCYAVKLGYELLVRQKPKQKQAPINAAARRAPARTASAAQPALPVKDTKLNRTDWIVMSALTAIYAAIALFHLGSFNAPQTFWKAAAIGDSFYADLGSSRSVGAIRWYSGIGDGSYRLEQSDDASSWAAAATLTMNGGTVFQWQQQSVSFTARYVKITAQQPGAALGELGLFESGSGALIAVQRIKPIQISGGMPEADTRRVFDEQDAIPDKPSYRNGMYFDEIYHARTAYEHLQRLEPFETTHPPLGKLFISAGIALFGMTPFGWRIPGTLLGIAMVPLMYLFGKRCFGRTEYAFITAFLMAFDFMHFTQTRLATIDVFGVFFIILMYYFMYRYYVMSFYRTSLVKTLIPLGIAGLCFGIGSAGKWIGLYAGAGLAVILVLSLRERYKEYRAQKRQLPFIRNTWITLAWCCVFFLLVPAAIYVCAYIPFMQVPGPGHGLRNVIEFQKFMYNYHSHLVATHPFASSWWEWPLIRKPIWYYAGSFLPEGRKSSIVAMGNPAVWWLGIAAASSCLYLAIKRKDKRLIFVLTGLAAAYLPWIGVSRLTFIYHFFASVPFLILCIVYMIQYLREHKGVSRAWTYAYLGVAGMLFILFYPILSGADIAIAYADHYLRWFGSWIF